MKSATLSIRIEPEIKHMLEKLADHDRRSVTSMIETLIYKQYEDTFNNAKKD